MGDAMKRAVWIAAGAVAIVTLAGGVAAWQLTQRPDAREAPLRERAAASGKPTAVSAARGGDLEQRVQRLERKIAMLERQRAVARVLAGDDEDGEERGGAAPKAVDDPVFEMAVRDVVDRVGQERAEERRVERKERMQRWADRWTDQVATAVKLDAAQKAKVQQIMRDHFDAMLRAREATESGDAGAGPGGFRERRREMREALDKRLSQALTPAQLRDLTALRESGDLPGLWGGGGRSRRD
jgi:hypothetical protein